MMVANMIHYALEKLIELVIDQTLTELTPLFEPLERMDEDKIKEILEEWIEKYEAKGTLKNIAHAICERFGRVKGKVDVEKIEKIVEEKFKNITHFSFCNSNGREIEFGSKGLERERLFKDLSQSIATELEEE